ncbi:MAG TPA: fumarylacetoacetase [Fimbriimonas sp.]|nr:fumarylacetoacetase [Fimbriimonas sp.]
MSFVIPPTARSWVSVAPRSHFPIQNLPFGLARMGDQDESVVIRIGDQALVLTALADAGIISDRQFPLLDSFIAFDHEDIRSLRRIAFELLSEGSSTLRDNPDLQAQALVPVERLEMLVPVEIPAYVDFYSGIYHASNVGKMFRPDMPPLLPNYRHVPVAYNGRASSVVISGTPIKRPSGQVKSPNEELPRFLPTRELDFELEMGFFLAEGNTLGTSIPIGQAEDHILGLVLVDDWSARDIQRWEYQPLGPFLAKSFATSISPWIVLLDALEPFRCQGETQDPAPLSHLALQGQAHYDIRLEVSLQSQKMTRPQVISRSNAKHLYWTFVQQLAHATSNGSNTEPGDLYASGTISGPDPGSWGSLLELAWKGTQPLTMEETGETRAFLEDGDTLTITGYCEGDGFRVGFGEVRGTVQPAS